MSLFYSSAPERTANKKAKAVETQQIMLILKYIIYLDFILTVSGKLMKNFYTEQYVIKV